MGWPTQWGVSVAGVHDWKARRCEERLHQRSLRQFDLERVVLTRLRIAHRCLRRRVEIRFVGCAPEKSFPPPRRRATVFVPTPPSATRHPITRPSRTSSATAAEASANSYEARSRTFT